MRKYRITKVRDKNHECNIHQGNVFVVEVEELPHVIAITKETSEGAIITVEKKDCNNIGCDFFEICSITELQHGKKYTVKKINKKIECPKRFKLYIVETKE